MPKQKPISQILAEKTFQELAQAQAQAKRTQSRSRNWQSPHGYRFLIPWTNAVLLRILVKKWLDSLKKSSKSPYNPLNSSKDPLNPRLLSRLEAQVLDSLRSTIANIEEGFSRPTTSEYLQFLGYSQASLTEAKGDLERAQQDNLIKSQPNSSLKNLGIDLKSWNQWCRNPLNTAKLLDFPLESSKILYTPLKSSKGNYGNLKELKGSHLTYEILIELTNKTDYLLRHLVSSLETKLENDQKYYQIERARIKSNLPRLT